MALPLNKNHVIPIVVRDLLSQTQSHCEEIPCSLGMTFLSLNKNHVIPIVVRDLLSQTQSHFEEIPRFTRDDVPLLK
jgi:UDP-N-acetylglucosamine enolpyruvyl transferase